MTPAERARSAAMTTVILEMDCIGCGKADTMELQSYDCSPAQSGPLLLIKHRWECCCDGCGEITLFGMTTMAFPFPAEVVRMADPWR